MSDVPLVVIVGDSISMGYTPHVQKQLEGRARVERHEGNGGDSPNVLAKLNTQWLPALGERPDLIHVNCGLHDLRFWAEKNAYQVPLQGYIRNMATLAGELTATGAKIVWCSTTPVLDGAPGMSKEFPRKNEDVDAYNAAALEVMTAAGFAINNLNAFVKDLGPEKAITPDGVHFTDEAYVQLGGEVARVFAETLGF
jgi:isoamyl acetate esterase